MGESKNEERKTQNREDTPLGRIEIRERKINYNY